MCKMSNAGNVQQIQQDIEHELVIANQLLRLISIELQVIKNFTSLGGEFETSIKHNASLMSTLANLQHVDLSKIPPMVRNVNNDKENNNEEHNRSHSETD